MLFKSLAPIFLVGERMYFNDVEAIKYSVDEAIVMNNLRFWILKNKANNKHFYDGKYWTYNSQQAMMELFPFWTRRQIQRIIKSLLDRKILIVGNFNKLAYDKTTWYAFSDEKYMLEPACPTNAPNGAIDCTISCHRLNQTVLSIEPNGSTYTRYNTDINTYITNSEKDKKELVVNLNDFEIDDFDKFFEVCNEWFDYKKSRKNMYKTQKGVDKFIKTLVEYSNGQYKKAQQIVDTSICNNYQGIFPLRERY